MKKVYYITKKNSNKTMQGIQYLELLEICFIQDDCLLEKIRKSDCLIFTSKNAIFALEHFAPQIWKKLPCCVIGNGSKKALESFGIKAEFVAKNPYGVSFGEELGEFLANKKPLFIRGQKVASNLLEILRNKEVFAIESILYQNKILKLSQKQREILKPKKDSIIFFSAPSSIKAFLKNFSWEDDYIALCIGKTTKNEAKKLLGENAEILLSPKVEIKSSLEFAKEIGGYNVKN